MNNSIEVKSMAGYLNFISDEKVPFSKLISDLRSRLEVLEQKKISKIACAIWLGGRELSSNENLELMDTFKNYGIENVLSIN